MTFHFNLLQDNGSIREIDLCLDHTMYDTLSLLDNTALIELAKEINHESFVELNEKNQWDQKSIWLEIIRQLQEKNDLARIDTLSHWIPQSVLQEAILVRSENNPSLIYRAIQSLEIYPTLLFTLILRCEQKTLRDALFIVPEGAFFLLTENILNNRYSADIYELAEICLRTCIEKIPYELLYEVGIESLEICLPKKYFELFIENTKSTLDHADFPMAQEKTIEQLLLELKESNKDHQTIVDLVENNVLINQINRIHAAYQADSVLLPAGIPICTWGEKECRNWSNQLKSQRDTATNIDFYPEMIAVIIRAVECYAGYIPRDVQLLSLLLLLNAGEKGRLLQIATGEGKSIIVAMFAIIKSFQAKIDISSSSPILAERESTHKINLFRFFNLTVSNNWDEKKGTEPYVTGYKNCYDADIVYGGLTSFQWDLLRHESCEDNTRGVRPYHAMIVDEVDSMFVDGLSDMAIIARLRPGMDLLELILASIWQELARIHQVLRNPETSTVDLDVVKKLLHDYADQLVTDKNSEIIVPNHLKEFVFYQAKNWVDYAVYARYHCELGRDYVITHNEEKQESIAPIEKNTGVILANNVWDNGLHQFIQLKHNIPLKAEQVFSCFISNISYFNRYGRQLFGLTGTLGNADAQHFLKTIYPVDLVIVPTFRTKRFVEIPGVLSRDWIKDVSQSIQKEIHHNRAVLIICESINAVDAIETVLKNIYGNDAKNIKRYSRNDNDECAVVEEVVNVGDIIIATNLAGRGTDLRTSAELERNGGLHVCLTFLPDNQRIEDQAFGRTARQGNLGTGQLIVNQLVVMQRFMPYIPTGAPLLTMEDIKLFRDQAEKDRLERIMAFDVKVMMLKDSLFASFCALTNELKLIDDNKHRIATAQDRFGFWIKKWTDQIHRTQLLDEKAIKDDFNIFKQEIISDYRDSKKLNPCDLITEANFSQSARGAIEMYSEAIELDPIASVQSYYNRAFSRMKTRDGNYKKEAVNDLESAKKILSENIIPQLCATQLIVNLNPEQQTSQTPLIQQISSKINFYRYQIKHIEFMINKINASDKDLIPFDTDQLFDAFQHLQLPKWHYGEIMASGLSFFYDVVEEEDDLNILDIAGVVFLGILQIVAGVAIVMASGGMALPLGTALISEGVGDLIYAARAVIEGHFDWDEYLASKATSVAVTIITIGVDIIKAHRAEQLAIRNGSKQAVTESAKRMTLAQAKTCVTQALVTAGVKEAVNYGMDYLTREALRGIKSDIKDSVKNDVRFLLNQEPLKNAINKLLSCANSQDKNKEMMHYFKQVAQQVLLTNSLTKNVSSTILQGVINNHHRGLGNLLKLVEMTDALQKITELTESVCDEFSQKIISVSQSYPDTETDYPDELDELSDYVADIITKNIISSLHGHVISPASHLLFDDKIQQFAEQIQIATHTVQDPSEAIKYCPPETQEIEDKWEHPDLTIADNSSDAAIINEASDLFIVYEPDWNNDYLYYSSVLNEEIHRPSLLVAESPDASPLSWTQSLADYVSDKTNEWKLVERSLGALQCVGGVGQVAIGVTGGTLTAETGVGALWGAGLATIGVDNMMTGCTQAWTGQADATLLNKSLTGLGLTTEQAAVAELGTNIAPLISAPLTKSAATTLSQIGLFGRQLGQDAIDTTRHAKTFIDMRHGNIFSQPTVFHSKTSLESAARVYNGIDPAFFKVDNRFGKAFYVAEHGPTTINELAYHGARASHAIRYQLSTKNAKILDLTQPGIAKKYGYLGGDDYQIPQAIAKQARQEGYNIIRFPSERGSGANLAILNDYEEILAPGKIIDVPKKQPNRFSNPWK